MTASDLALLKASHRKQLALCAELEEIADNLPDHVNRQRCLHLARSLCPIIMEAHALEECALFSKVHALAHTLPNLDITIERLRWEHFEDLCFSEELREALLDLGRADRPINGEALGYMLRGFFESLRRHVAFEQEMLMPLLDLAKSDATRNGPGEH
ncbi:MAG: hemerythrin domain-containing protein [Aliihoeflea sp.]|uniref:hemerythrin domain-containing protein n=1 Tax=Aliihoeflea sp. TaxID=2608088 RepID=UPI004037972E